MGAVFSYSPYAKPPMLAALEFQSLMGAVFSYSIAAGDLPPGDLGFNP